MAELVGRRCFVCYVLILLILTLVGIFDDRKSLESLKTLYASLKEEQSSHISSHSNMPTTTPWSMSDQTRRDALDFFQQLAALDVDKWSASKLGTTKAVLTPEAAHLIEQTNLVAAEILRRPVPPVVDYSPPKITINCGDPTFSDTLTGRLDPYEKIIVDIALFGYDADFLEIRLLEYSDLIHSFLVPEQNITFKGIPKPFLVPTLLEGRLASFRDKIEYLPQIIGRHIFESMYRVGNGNMNEMWKIEGSLRYFALEHVKAEYSSHPSSSHVYVIQNDGDEIISRTAMAHFKACELREPGKKIYFPNPLFKRNIAWLWNTNDFRARLDLGPIGQSNLNVLKNTLWRLGPHILRLKETTFDNFRKDPWLVRGGYNHMGLGAANHFSNPSHYILNFLKLVSTVDAHPAPVPPTFWQKATERKLSDVDMRSITYLCSMPVAPLDALGTSITQFVLEHLPWAVRSLSERYPWLYREDILEMEGLLHSCICKNELCNDTRLELTGS